MSGANSPEAWFARGQALETQGRPDEAMACFQRAVEGQPNAAGAHYCLGVALARKGALPQAADSLRRAIASKPNLVEAHDLLGEVLHRSGRWTEAAIAYREALRLRPDSAVTHSNLGMALYETGAVEDAVANLERAVTLRPDLAATHNNLGAIHHRRGNLVDAAQSFRQALALEPDLAAAHNNLGLVLKDEGRWDEAYDRFQRARTLQPDLADTHHNLGLVHKQRGQLDAAVACYRQAIALQPNFATAHNNLGNVLKDMGRLDEALASFQCAVKCQPDLVDAHSNLVYSLLFAADLPPASLRAELEAWERQHAAPLAVDMRPHLNERSPGRRLRVGYVSPNFNDHCQALFMLPLLEAHNRTAFEIYAYASVPAPDQMTDRLRRKVDVWRDALRLSDAQLAERIRADGIDVLVDVTMHMAHHRLLTFARKPAPVQITWLAYPGTTGLKTFDARLTDPHLDPPGLFEAHYSEDSVRLPDTFWCYHPLTEQPCVNPLPAITRGHITFGCLNNFCKVNAKVLRLWAQVLAAVPKSRLLVLCPEGSHRQATHAVFEAEGVTPDRVEFLAPRPRARYLEVYHLIDVCLDTSPYNGHTTSLDSYWMGVPVVTLVGASIVGRAGWSQLSNLGLTELAAHSPEGFVRIASELAGDRPRLASLRAMLRKRMQDSPLMDAPRFARAIEEVFRDRWQRWCAAKETHAIRKT
jgi:protein O-GlcNAc transferase